MKSLEESIKMTKPFTNPRQKAMVNLVYTYNWLNNYLRETIEAFDITSQQYNVLRILKGSHPEPVTSQSIRDVMLDKNPDLTRLCDRLEQKNFITRKENPLNKRQMHIRITSTGIDMVNKITPVLERNTNQFISIDENEALQLSDLLDKMRSTPS
jgi:MarR family transcriptional regulator, 2-MHQ and catechol-resistance regulon repressor